MIARTLRGLAALAALLLLLAGWPAALALAGAAAGPWLPDLADPAGLLARPDTGGLFLLLVLALGWAAWAVWAAALLAEAAAQVRGVPTPRLGGLFPQRSAAALVTAVAVAFAAPAGTALADPAPPPAAAAAAADAAGPATAAEAPGPGPGPADYTVQPGDTLWDIAAEQLGDPYRWPQIAEASDDLPQPGGRDLENPDLILPGWTLRLPPAAVPAQPPAPVDGPGGASGSSTGTDGRTGGMDGTTGAADPEPDPAPNPGLVLPRTPLAAAGGPAPTDAEVHATDARNGTAAAGLPETPMAAGAGAVDGVGDEGRAGPVHGVLGLPDWIAGPLIPTAYQDAPDVAAALAAPAR